MYDNSDIKLCQHQVLPVTRKFSLGPVGIVFIACVCGWFMMQLEILGTRILVPFFGGAVHVITGSVIGVFLLSLSIGYLLGGWLCSKVNAWVWLGIVMILVGIWKYGIPLITDPLCDPISNSGMDEKWGALLSSLILFGVPTVLLGTVSPIVVHWLTARTGNSGFSAGLVLATSTMASFSGCVVTAFYFVLYSLENTLKKSGIILVILGAIVLITIILQAWINSRIDKRGV